MTKLFVLLLITTWLALSGCGAGEGGTGGTGLTEEQRVVSYGVITNVADNEITVQNTRFATSGAVIQLNKQTVTTTDLKTGMVASVEGTRTTPQNTAIANRVDLNDTISGPITEVREDNSVVVLGHVIKFDDDTHYKNDGSAQSLSTGKQISVMGFLSADGEIKATFINSDDADSSQSVSGYISAVDKDNFTFTVGSLTIDYISSSSIDSEMRDQLAVGLLVEIEGIMDGNSGKFIAHEIEFAKVNRTDDLEDIEAEVEGFISSKLSDTEFVIQGSTVKVTADTRYDHGSASTIQAGVKAHVKGVLRNGVIEAQRIEFDL